MVGPEGVAGQTGAPRPPQRFPVREVHRRDLDPFLTVVLSNAGELERQLGLLQRAERQIRLLARPGLWLLLSLLRILHRGPVRLLMAEDGRSLVGTTIVMLAGPWAYVAAVGVDAAHRRRGIAQELVRRAEQVGRDAGKRWLILEVDAENEPAKQLYSKLAWSRGATVRWWELLSPALAGEGGSVRRASSTDQKRARSAWLDRLRIDLPRGYVHPCELACGALGGAQCTWAAGGTDVPTVLVRAWAGRPGESGFLLPTFLGGSEVADEETVLQAGREELVRRGSRGIFVPVVGTEGRLEALLSREQAVPRTSSEIWWKRLTADR